MQFYHGVEDLQGNLHPASSLAYTCLSMALTFANSFSSRYRYYYRPG
jgi:hypothetical protein